MPDKKAQALMDDYKNLGINSIPVNSLSATTVAEQQSKLYSEANRLVLRDLGERLSASQWKELMDSLNEYAYRTSGAGGFSNQYQQAFTGFDKYGYNPIAPNTVLSGYTFITRPKLNLSPGAVKSHPTLGFLDTVNLDSPLFIIRCLLDTKFCEDYRAYVSNCHMVDFNSPFLKILTNCTRSHSGWPDLNGDTTTTDGGYFNEDQTAFLGYDELNRTYDLTIEFTDIQGGHVMALFYYWFLYLSALKRNKVMAYGEDIDRRRLCYTVSIYRFLLDPSKQTLVGWAKATGCFPKSVPIGALFNINSGEIHVSSAQRFSIPFVANKIEYNEPFILTDFNTVTRRFKPNIDSGLIAPINDPKYNFIGRPLIRNVNNGYKLVWLYEPNEEPILNLKNTIDILKSTTYYTPVPIEGIWNDTTTSGDTGYV